MTFLFSSLQMKIVKLKTHTKKKNLGTFWNSMLINASFYFTYCSHVQIVWNQQVNSSASDGGNNFSIYL